MDLSTIGTAIGAALMIGSPVVWGWWRWHVARHWTIVDGEVVRLEPSGPESDSDLTYRPVIKAKRQDGETTVFTSPYGTDPSPWKVGDSVAVRVRGDVVKHDSFGAAFLGYGSLFAFGAFIWIKSKGG